MKALSNQSTATQHVHVSRRTDIYSQTDPPTRQKPLTQYLRRLHTPPTRDAAEKQRGSAHGGEPTSPGPHCGEESWAMGQRRAQTRDFMTTGLNLRPGARPQRSRATASRTRTDQHGHSPWPRTWTQTKAVASFSSPNPLFYVLSCMTLSLRIHVKRLW